MTDIEYARQVIAGLRDDATAERREAAFYREGGHDGRAQKHERQADDDDHSADAINRTLTNAAASEQRIAELEAEVGNLRYCLDFNATSADETKTRLEAEVAMLRAHPPHPTLQRDLTEEEYSTGQLVEFLREAAGRDGIGAWRAKEFAQAATRIEEYEDAYLAVCPYEARVAELEAALGRAKDLCSAPNSVLIATERVRAALAVPEASVETTCDGYEDTCAEGCEAACRKCHRYKHEHTAAPASSEKP